MEMATEENQEKPRRMSMSAFHIRTIRANAIRNRSRIRKIAPSYCTQRSCSTRLLSNSGRHDFSFAQRKPSTNHSE